MIDVFEPYSCFTRIDRNNSGTITSQEIVQFMRETGSAELSEFEINYVIKFFDSTFRGCLNYQDFMQIILPCDNQLLRTQATQQREAVRTKQHEYLRGDLESELAVMLEYEIMFHLKLEQMKLDLSNIEDYKLRRLFKMVDAHGKKYIDSGAVRRYLQNMGHQVLPEEVKAIIRRLDIDGDQKINYNEFVESISPVSPDFIPAKAITDSYNQNYLD